MTAGGLMNGRAVRIVEDIFTQRLLTDGRVAKEVAAQRGRLRLNRSQTLILDLRSEKQNKSCPSLRWDGNINITHSKL